MHINSIRTRLIVLIIILLFLVGSITGGIAYYISYDGLLDTVYNNISSKAVDTANIVASGVETELKIVEAMAQNDIFKTGDLTSQLDFLRREEKRLG